jgi:hypothetical protein
MIPMAFPFLNNIRRLYDGSKPNQAKRKLRQHHRDDASILQKILDLAHRGIDMHKRVDCFPDCLSLADSCPTGMGGYSINSGVAWHFNFPADSNFINMNNLLEFLAQAVSILLELEQWRAIHVDWREDLQGPVISPLCDNFAAQAWHDHSNFNPATHAGHNFVAHFVAAAVIDHCAKINSFHLPGKINVVSDFLSRKDLQLSANCHSDADLTKHVLNNFTNQVPSNFRVCPLSKEINSFICSMLALLTVSSTESKKQVKKQSTGLGADGASTASPSAKPIPSLTPTTPVRNNLLFSPSHNVSDPTISLQETVQSLFFRRLSVRPLSTWHRYSCVTTGQAPSTASTTMPHIFQP